MKRPKRLFHRIPSGNPETEKLMDGAECRQEVFRLNEFKIRLIKQRMVDAGLGPDCIVLLLDMQDGLARRIYQAYREPSGHNTSQLQIVGTQYSVVRECFSPNHRDTFDACKPGDIRTALFSEGRTLVMNVPGDCKLDDIRLFICVQDEESRRKGTRLPDWVNNLH
jgi:hypothetical protein